MTPPDNMTIKKHLVFMDLQVPVKNLYVDRTKMKFLIAKITMY